MGRFVWAISGPLFLSSRVFTFSLRFLVLQRLFIGEIAKLWGRKRTIIDKCRSAKRETVNHLVTGSIPAWAAISNPP